MNKNRRQAYAVNRTLAIRPPLSPGVLAVLSLVFPVAVLTVLARVPSATCAVGVACSTQPRPGASGTERSAASRRNQLQNTWDQTRSESHRRFQTLSKGY